MQVRAGVAAMVGGLVLAAWLASVGCAGKAKPKPAAMDEAAMMEAWQKAMTPGAMHERLMRNAGTWDAVMKWRMDPNGPWVESRHVQVNTPMMDGRFMRSETRGMVEMGPGQMAPFEGFAVYGYNNTDQRFESVWADNMGTTMIVFTGKMRDDGAIEWFGKFTDPMTGQPTWMREIERLESPGVMMLEFWGPRPDGKGEFQTMTLRATKR